MRIRIFGSCALGLAALLTLAAVPVLAQGPPAPAPEMATLAYFGGDWVCTGKVDATPMGPEHATKAKVGIHKQLGGFWYVGRYAEQKSASNPFPMSFEFLMGYDGAGKALTMDGYDVFGNRSHQTSAGWQGDKIVFDGQSTGPDGKSFPARDTFLKKSETVMEHDGEFQFEAGQWAHVDHEVCKRIKK